MRKIYLVWMQQPGETSWCWRVLCSRRWVELGNLWNGGWGEEDERVTEGGVERICQTNEKMKIWQRGDGEFSLNEACRLVQLRLWQVESQGDVCHRRLPVLPQQTTGDMCGRSQTYTVPTLKNLIGVAHQPACQSGPRLKLIVHRTRVKVMLILSNTLLSVICFHITFQTSILGLFLIWASAQ